MAVIKSPNQEYTGTSAGVTFVNGVGNTDNENLIEWFRDHGYEVEIDAEVSTEEDLEEKEIDDMEKMGEKDEKEIEKAKKPKK
nr:MAG TPA: hypothetical protein [Caudoviricetes sp.]